MRKVNKNFILAVLLIPMVVLAASLVVTGSVNLTHGKYVYSDNAKIDKRYPFISVENNESTSNAHFSSVLMKKKLLGYSNIQRLNKKSSYLGDHSYFFEEVDSGTYRISIIGEDGTTKFDYAFTSSNERA